MEVVVVLRVFLVAINLLFLRLRRKLRIWISKWTSLGCPMPKLWVMVYQAIEHVSWIMIRRRWDMVLKQILILFLKNFVAVMRERRRWRVSLPFGSLIWSFEVFALSVVIKIIKRWSVKIQSSVRDLVISWESVGFGFENKVSLIMLIIKILLVLISKSIQ